MTCVSEQEKEKEKEKQKQNKTTLSTFHNIYSVKCALDIFPLCSFG